MSFDKGTDYITLNQAVRWRLWNVVIMKYDAHEREHRLFRISEAIPKSAATALSRSWAASTGLEVR